MLDQCGYESHVVHDLTRGATAAPTSVPRAAGALRVDNDQAMSFCYAIEVRTCGKLGRSTQSSVQADNERQTLASGVRFRDVEKVLAFSAVHRDRSRVEAWPTLRGWLLRAALPARHDERRHHYDDQSQTGKRRCCGPCSGHDSQQKGKARQLQLSKTERG